MVICTLLFCSPLLHFLMSKNILLCHSVLHNAPLYGSIEFTKLNVLLKDISVISKLAVNVIEMSMYFQT